MPKNHISSVMEQSSKPQISISKKLFSPSQKYKSAIELINLIEMDDTLSDALMETMTDGYIEPVTYAPNMGYNVWIIKFKKVYVALLDDGNGHCTFFTIVSKLQVLWSKIYLFFDNILFKLDKKKEN